MEGLEEDPRGRSRPYYGNRISYHVLSEKRSVIGLLGRRERRPSYRAFIGRSGS